MVDEAGKQQEEIVNQEMEGGSKQHMLCVCASASFTAGRQQMAEAERLLFILNILFASSNLVVFLHCCGRFFQCRHCIASHPRESVLVIQKNSFALLVPSCIYFPSTLLLLQSGLESESYQPADDKVQQRTNNTPLRVGHFLTRGPHWQRRRSSSRWM